MELCLEVIEGGKDVCGLMAGHDGDHAPGAEGARPGQAWRIEGACEFCNATVVFEGEAGGMAEPARKLAEAALRRGVLCATCADIDERAHGASSDRESEEDRRRRFSGIPEKWRAQTFGALDDEGDRARAVELAAGWGQEEFAGVLLWGDVGRGKTAIAAAAANLMLRRRGVRWVPVSELLLDLRMPFESVEYIGAARRLDGRGSQALVLDDLDKLKPTEHAVAPLYTAINRWIEAELPLLVTLNRDLDALSAWMPDTFGEAIGSRLAGYCKVREVRGVDRRLG
jgi:DNA replication protein DnaC